MTLTEDHDLFALFAEYSGLTVAEVRSGAEVYGHFNEVHWQECTGPSWEERAQEFYRVANGYVFDLINSNQSKTHLRDVYRRFGHWPWLVKSGPDVLEFGGGAGLACSVFRDLGRNVTYVDVDGPVSQFARWYFERTDQTDIEMLLTPPDRLVLPEGRTWDFVFSDSVIEHLIDPAGTVDRLANAVRPGGVLYLIIDAHNVGGGLPMHRHVYLSELLEASETLRSMEHVLAKGDGWNVFRAPATPA